MDRWCANDDGLVRVGILGCGNVGAALVGLLDANADLITRRSGVAARGRAGRGPEPHEGARRRRSRPACSPTTPGSVVADPDVDVIVEVIGGVEPARSLILAALEGGQAGRHREQGAARQRRRRSCSRPPTRRVSTCLFEASVAGGIPLIRPLRESLAGERIRRVTGIVNGTTNYVLTRMTEERCSFADALAEAQELGYAERDPTADVEGFDAAAKAAIIASIAFGAQRRRGRRVARGHHAHHRRRHRGRAPSSATS